MATLREVLAAGEPLYGGWSTVPGAQSVTALAGAGLDYVVIDLQHGGAGEHDLPGMCAAIVASGATPLARLRYAHPGDVGRALDLGVHGVIVPNVESAAQARTIAGACRYPPAGFRSAGRVLGGTDDPLCLIMVESRGAMDELPETLTIEGVDGIYVGPRDLSYSLGCGLDPHDPVLSAALDRIWAACRTAGKPVGVHAADGPTARHYRERGCQFVTVISDVASVSAATRQALEAARAG